MPNYPLPAEWLIVSFWWFVPSSCMFSRACLEKLKRLIRNYIWAGKDQEISRAKVARRTITLPKSPGGMGLIDPWQQSKPSLGKFVVRRLRPDVGPWSKYLLDCMCAYTPRTDWLWRMRRFCLSNIQIPRFTGSEYKLINGILQEWKELPTSLVQIPPSSHEARMRQPLIWNPRFRTFSWELFGQPTNLAWGKMASRPTTTRAMWNSLMRLNPDRQKAKLHTYKQMMQKLRKGIWENNPKDSPLLLEGLFRRT